MKSIKEKKIPGFTAIVLGMFFYVLFFGYLDIANAAGTIKEGNTCVNYSDCVSGTYCYNGMLNNYCKKQLSNQEVCAKGSYVAQSELLNCKYGCPNNEYYNAYKDTTAVIAEYRCGKSGETKTGAADTSKETNDKSSTADPTKAAAATTTAEFPNPLKYTSLSQVLVAIMVNLQSFLAIIAIIIIIIGGIMYMFSGGNENMITKAKTTIGGALIGLAIILAAPSFLKQIKLTLGGGITGASADEVVSKAYTIKDIAISVVNLLLSTIGILGIIALIVGGVMYVTAYGSEDRVGLAKKIIGSALVGILIAFGALILVKQIAALLGAA